tara:strand:- start:504 stop:710 length:207 start_codon:yes stop_codon:yes gene_type:complete
VSLKSFHIVFVTCAVLFSAGFGYWALQAFQMSGDGIMLTLSLTSFLATVALLVYGVWFLKKLRGWSYL